MLGSRFAFLSRGVPPVFRAGVGSSLRAMSSWDDVPLTKSSAPAASLGPFSSLQELALLPTQTCAASLVSGPLDFDIRYVLFETLKHGNLLQSAADNNRWEFVQAALEKRPDCDLPEEVFLRLLDPESFESPHVHFLLMRAYLQSDGSRRFLSREDEGGLVLQLKLKDFLLANPRFIGECSFADTTLLHGLSLEVLKPIIAYVVRSYKRPDVDVVSNIREAGLFDAVDPVALLDEILLAAMNSEWARGYPLIQKLCGSNDALQKQLSALGDGRESKALALAGDNPAKHGWLIQMMLNANPSQARHIQSHVPNYHSLDVRWVINESYQAAMNPRERVRSTAFLFNTEQGASGTAPDVELSA